MTLTFLDVYLQYDYRKNGDKNTFWLAFASDLLTGWAKSSVIILDSAQISIMCDENMNSTHFAVMITILNFANGSPYIIGTFVIGFCSYYYWAGFCIVYNFIFLICTRKYFLDIDNTPKSDFIWQEIENVPKENENYQISNHDNSNIVYPQESLNPNNDIGLHNDANIYQNS